MRKLLKSKSLSAALLIAFIVISALFISTPKKTPRSEYHSSDLMQVITKDGNLTRTDYVDEDGNIRIAANMGFATKLVVREDLSELETYLDDQGERISRYSGYYGILRAYDDAGRVIRITYLDAENAPVVMSEKYAVEEREYNELGQQVSSRYLDAAGNPALSSYNGYGARYEYNDKGRRSRITYLDAAGEPMVLSSGYSSISREFYETEGPENGKVKREFYFLPNGTPAVLYLGHSGIYKEYNEIGQTALTTYLDADGNPMVTNKGYTSVAYTYHPNNSVETTLYYDVNGKPYRMSEGQYGTRDDYGQTVYLNADGTAQFNIKNLAYNDSGFVIVIAILVVLLSTLVRRKLNWLLLIMCIGAILYFTLMFRKAGEPEIGLLRSYRRFFVSADARADILKNIWLFVPLGAILFRLYPHKWVLAAPVLFSVAIEIVQYTTGVGLSELDDVISNGLGSVLGFGMAWLVKTAWRQFKHEGRS